LLFASMLVLTACSKERTIEVINGSIMATQYQVKLVVDEPLSPNELKHISDGVSSTLQSIDQLMSTYKATSEVSRFNRAAIGDSISASFETLEVYRLSKKIFDASNGYFDPTIGSLVNAWGFGPSGKQKTLESTQVSELLRLSAFKSVALENGRLRKLNNGSIDFSAIAKGYAVDAVSEYLSRIGQENYLIELGGEIYAAGTNQAGVSWRLGIEEPDFMGRKSYNVVEINNQALATSGDYRNFIEENGHRYSHTIDPKTGYPVERSVASVSVIAATCAEADAWATALSAMGSEKAVNFAEENKLNAFFILRQDESFLTAVTGEFGRHLLTKQG